VGGPLPGSARQPAGLRPARGQAAAPSDTRIFPDVVADLRS